MCVDTHASSVRAAVYAVGNNNNARSSEKNKTSKHATTWKFSIFQFSPEMHSHAVAVPLIHLFCRSTVFFFFYYFPLFSTRFRHIAQTKSLALTRQHTRHNRQYTKADPIFYLLFDPVFPKFYFNWVCLNHEMNFCENQLI